MRLCLRLVDVASGCSAALRELLAEPALSFARHGDHPDHPSTPILGLLERIFEQPHLLGSADAARETTLPGEVEPRACRAHADQLEHSDRTARSLHVEFAQVLELEIALGQFRR